LSERLVITLLWAVYPLLSPRKNAGITQGRRKTLPAHPQIHIEHAESLREAEDRSH
jgi:hypothetical protein